MQWGDRDRETKGSIYIYSRISRISTREVRRVAMSRRCNNHQGLQTCNGEKGKAKSLKTSDGMQLCGHRVDGSMEEKEVWMVGQRGCGGKGSVA